MKFGYSWWVEDSLWIIIQKPERDIFRGFSLVELCSNQHLAVRIQYVQFVWVGVWVNRIHICLGLLALFYFL